MAGSLSAGPMPDEDQTVGLRIGEDFQLIGVVLYQNSL